MSFDRTSGPKGWKLFDAGLKDPLDFGSGQALLHPFVLRHLWNCCGCAGAERSHEAFRRAFL